MNRLRAQLTFSNVMATIAVFVALGGGAYAVGSSFVGSGGAIQGCVAKGGVLRVVKPGKRCPKGRVSLVFDTRGPVGTPGLQGPKGEPGTPGLQGPKGEPGSALAFAHVIADGTVDTARSKNVPASSVTADGMGRYCFSLSITPQSIQVTPDDSFTTPVTAVASVTPPYAFGCPSTAKAEVQEFISNTGAKLANGFYVVFN